MSKVMHPLLPGGCPGKRAWSRRKPGHRFGTEILSRRHPLLLLLLEHGPHEPQGSRHIGEDPDDVQPTHQHPNQPFQDVGRMDPPPVFRREGHIGRDVLVCRFQARRHLRIPRPKRLVDLSETLPGQRLTRLGKDASDLDESCRLSVFGHACQEGSAARASKPSPFRSPLGFTMSRVFPLTLIFECSTITVNLSESSCIPVLSVFRKNARKPRRKRKGPDASLKPQMPSMHPWSYKSGERIRTYNEHQH